MFFFDLSYVLASYAGYGGEVEAESYGSIAPRGTTVTLSMIRPAGERKARQAPFGVAVVLPSLLRPDLTRAVRSVFAQDFADRVQILVGVDVPDGDPEQLEALVRECPSHIALDVFDPGYSTSVRHGGIHENRVSGSLRTILTFAANSRYIAYLDDDNWWAPNHLSSLRAAVDGTDWSWSKRWFVGPGEDQPICVDEWESVGLDAGVFRETFGGFVDPSSLMIDKLRCRDAVPAWANTAFSDGRGADRLVFEVLAKNYRPQGTGLATSYYTINPDDILHVARLRWFRQKGLQLSVAVAGSDVTIAALLGAGGEAAAIPAPSPALDDGKDPVFHALLSALKPRDALVVGDPEGELAIHLVQALRNAGSAAPVLAIAPRGARAYQRVEERFVAAGLTGALWLMPKEKSIDDLLEQRATTDLLRIGPAVVGAAELDRLWPLLRPGGLLIGPGQGNKVVERFARTHGGDLARLRLSQLGACWIIEKGAGDPLPSRD